MPQNAPIHEYRKPAKANKSNTLEPNPIAESQPQSRQSAHSRSGAYLPARTSSLENFEVKERISIHQDLGTGKDWHNVDVGYRSPMKNKKPADKSTSARNSYEKVVSRLQGVEILLSAERSKNSSNVKTGRASNQYQPLEKAFSSHTKENINNSERSSRLSSRSVISFLLLAFLT